MKGIFSLAALLISFSSVTANEFYHLGHTYKITLLKKSMSFLASQDDWGFWTVWNLENNTPILSGKVDPQRALDLKNNVLIIPGQDAFDIYHLPNTAPQHIPADSLANLYLTWDGWYIWSGSNTKLRVWNTTGQQVISISGNHLFSKLSSDSANIFIADSGSDSIAIASTTNFNERSVLHFDGGFCCWITEGKRFLSQQGTIIRTYSTSGFREALQDISMTTNTKGLYGYGSFFWMHNEGAPAYELRIYKIGTSSNPIKIVPTMANTAYIGHNGFIGILPPEADSLIVCKLEQDTVSTIINKGAGQYLSFFECDSQGTWYTGNQNGVINGADLDHSPRYVNHGKIQSLSGTPNGYFSAASSNGQILLFQCINNSIYLIDSIPSNASSIKLSIDGTRLASCNDSSLTIYSISDHTVIRQWIFHDNDERDRRIIQDFDFSDNGLFASLKTGIYPYPTDFDSNSLTLYDVSREEPIYDLQNNNIISPQVSPNGTFSVIWIDSIIKLYHEANLIDVFSGSFGGWCDDNHIIVNKYTLPSDSGLSWIGTYLMDSSGRLDSTMHFPNDIFNSKKISDSEITATIWNNTNSFPKETRYPLAIYNLHTGKKLFSLTLTISGNQTPLSTATNTDFIVYQSDTALNLLNWRQNQIVVLQKRPTNNIRSSCIDLAKGNLIASFSPSTKCAVTLCLFTLTGATLSNIDLGCFYRGDNRITIPLARILTKNPSSSSPFIAVLKTNSSIIICKRLVALK